MPTHARAYASRTGTPEVSSAHPVARWTGGTGPIRSAVMTTPPRRNTPLLCSAFFHADGEGQNPSARRAVSGSLTGGSSEGQVRGSAGHERRRHLDLPQVRADLAGVVVRRQRVVVEQHHVAAGTGPERGLAVGAGGQRLGGGECLLGVPRSPRRRRCGGRPRTSPATGPEPRPGRRIRAPARRRRSSIERNAKQRWVRSGQHRSVTSRSSSRWAGWTLARTPSSAIRGRSARSTSWACSIPPRAPVAENASSPRLSAASPIACSATRRPLRWRRGEELDQLLGGVVEPCPGGTPAGGRRGTACSSTPSGCSASRPR